MAQTQAQQGRAPLAAAVKLAQRVQKLCAEAAGIAAQHRHRIGPWVQNGWDLAIKETSCTACGQCLIVDAEPEPGGYSIKGGCAFHGCAKRAPQKRQKKGEE